MATDKKSAKMQINAKEMLERRKDYEMRLAEFPAVKHVSRHRSTKPSRKTVPRGVPKLIAERMRDKNTAAAMNALRRVTKYRRDAADLTRRRLRGEKIPLNEQMDLIRRGENVDRDAQEMVRLAVKTARSNPINQAYAAAIAAQPDSLDIMKDLPNLMSRNEWAAMKYLGAEVDDFTSSWQRCCQDHGEAALKLLASGNLDSELERIEKSAGKIELPDSPRKLIKRDIMTLGGDSDIDELGKKLLDVFFVILSNPFYFLLFALGMLAILAILIL